MKIKFKWTSTLAYVVFYICFFVSYIVNLIKFIKCDFEAPWKEEIVHGIGVIIAFPAFITAWL